MFSSSASLFSETENTHTTSSSAASLSEVGSLRHPSHPEHDLNLRQLSEDCTCLVCEGCFDQIQGSAYCCEDCKFFLHKSCAKLQTEYIQHPFHPQHPLKRDFNQQRQRIPNYCAACGGYSLINFGCHACRATFCFSCVVATTPDEHSNTEAAIDLAVHHFSHAHPLKLCHIGMKSQITCKACTNNITGEVYGCYKCVFFLHKNCTGFFQEIRHPFHLEHPLPLLFNLSEYSKCNACGNHCCSSAYSCDQCKFNLHFDCAVSTMEFEISKDNGLLIDHLAHQHPLNSFHVKTNNRILCKACLENISGEMYGCTDCMFFLHRSCAQLPPKIEHPLHKEHSLALLPKSPEDSVSLNCSSCEESISSYAFAFSCRACKFALDVKCALGTLTFLEQGGSLEVEIPSHHHHPLQLCNWKNSYLRCEACEEAVEGQAYKCHSCNILLHRSCAELASEMKHPYHRDHTVSLHSGGVRRLCGACFKEYEGIGFCCEDCNFYVDFSCASRIQTFKHPLDKHPLLHFVKVEKCLRCYFCNKSCTVDLYRCVPCDFNVHKDCLQQLKLPPKIKHRHHFHQLTLADSFVEDDFEEYICDFCGIDRDLELGVYYCEECPRESTLTVHMSCALSGETVFIDKIREIEEARGNAPLAKLNRRIEGKEKQVEALKRQLAALEVELDGLKKEKEASSLRFH